ncbi:MAG: hypothetical protein Kow00102_15100 [Spirochaetota bacterium]
MKKIHLLYIIICITLFSFFFSVHGFAANLSVGVSTWYTSWDIAVEQNQGGGIIKTDRGLMYGPVLSVNVMDNWSISGVFLYGEFKNPEYSRGTADFGNFKRYDFDGTINYGLTNFLKIFIGGKYVKFDFLVSNQDASYYMYGPGAGASVIFNIVDNLYFTANTSYVYMKGKAELVDSSSSMITKGINSSASLGYYFASTSVTVYIGGRYQRLFEDRKVEDSFKYHEMMGVTAAATYSFML